MISFKTILLKIYFYLNYFLRYFFIKTNSKKISTNLILISQIQRSGGTLLSQLLDGHDELLNYPNELIITSPKFCWNNEFNFITFFNDGLLRYCGLKKDYKKDGAGKIITHSKNEFIFDFYKQKKIFDSFKDKSNFRDQLDNFFSSFFYSFLNYKNLNLPKKHIIAFLPRFIFYSYNLELYFKAYENGKIISIVRDPETWLASSQKHHNEYEDISKSFEIYKKNLNYIIDAKKKFGDNIIIISFNDLVSKTKDTLMDLCRKLDINYDENIVLKPTFNGNEIRSDSSFQVVTGKIDNKVLKRSIDDNIKREFAKEIIICKNLAEKAIS